MNELTTQNAQTLLQEAQGTLREIKALLAAENAILVHEGVKAKLPDLERVLPDKKKLTLRLEKTLNTLKRNPAVLEDAQVSVAARAFEAELAAFQADAVANLTKLRAAHQVRADFIGMEKDTVMKLDGSQTYGQSGALRGNVGPTRSVLGKSV